MQSPDLISNTSVKLSTAAMLALLVLTSPLTRGSSSSMFEIGHAKIYYETSGQGVPILFIHAGVADSRQWNNEFISFST